MGKDLDSKKCPFQAVENKNLAPESSVNSEHDHPGEDRKLRECVAGLPTVSVAS